MVWSGTTTRLLEHQQLRSTVDCLVPEPARVQHKARCHVINFASHKSVEGCHSDGVKTHGASLWRTIALSLFFCHLCRRSTTLHECSSVRQRRPQEPRRDSPPLPHRPSVLASTFLPRISTPVLLSNTRRSGTKVILAPWSATNSSR